MLKAALTTFMLLASPLFAQGVVTYQSDDSFDDVLFGLQNAILDQGLVIDSTSHVGDMLERTRTDVGSDVVIFEKADILNFCSASLSRKVMEADPMNLQFCPYGIFVYTQPEQPGRTTIGYRQMPDGPMKEVEALLDSISRAAVGLD